MKHQEELHKGYRLGKYKLIRRLGKGAYGSVWKVRDTVEEQHVALKIAEVPADASEKKFIFKEIATLLRLDHPHIVRIKNADIIDKWIIIATELGMNSLHELRLPLSSPKAISITLQVLNALFD